jgi:3-oxoadipate enol-lactonase
MSPAVEVFHVAEGPADAPVVVLSNSLGTSLDMWEPQVHELARRFRVVRYDLRGHGRSPVPPGPYSIDDLGGDLLALLDRLGVERAHLCGLSIGGMLSLWVSAHAPERVERLVVCCASPALPNAAAYTERAALVRREGMRPVVDPVIGRWFTSGYAGRNPGVIAEMQEMIDANEPEGYAGCCEAIAGMDLEPALSAIRAPTLAIAGADDHAIPPAESGRICRGVVDCRLEVVNDAAHLVNVEQADAVTSLILSHLLPSSLEE